MHDTGFWLLILAVVAAVIFGKTKPTWHPFGGMFKHDRRTGQLTVAVTLPGRGKRKSARKKRR